MNGGSCAHTWQHKSRSWDRRPLIAPGACCRPRMFECQHCREVKFARCGTGDERKCEPCAKLKRGDLAAIAREGALREGDFDVYFITLTPPGRKVLPWDTSKCTHGDGVRCAGSLGCKVSFGALAEWHGSRKRAWSYFAQMMRRYLGVEVELMKAYELQKRGALHVHCIVRIGQGVTPEMVRAAADKYRKAYGWGTVDPTGDATKRLGRGMNGVALAAAYVAKYVTKCSGDLRGVPVFDESGSVVPTVFRAWSQTRNFGPTMKALAARRVAYLLARASAGGGPAGGAGAEGALDLYQGSSTEMGEAWGAVVCGVDPSAVPV